jgi:effector-binding domain-containing protein
MKSSKRLACFGALVLALVLPHAPVWPQGPTPSIGAPAPTSPPAVLDRPTLVPDAGDPVDGDEVTLPAKPAAILSGSSTWDEGFATLKKAFQRIEAELAKAGIGPAGRPVTVFTQTDDDGFRYDAMLPIDRAPEDRPPNLSPDLRFGTTPSGRALRFVHRGPYDDIDSTYETVTAYLDAKNIEVKDFFVEEYVSDFTSADDDASLEINIFAIPKQ